ncbi:DUF4355 domain-containing protein [Lacticaseibacillus paracasei]|jgi:hypothetical protein|uniref:DUF4355 domain-containing protein n=1 Tax=Lacticaseibacillus paracasei TaxID=1597 RepID=UPI000FEFF41D|nr:DUF4355 domain-containing protein [Lacticaseibacillus paracasei]MBF4175997.1 DUF4355 domain-containing protein [Lacticaseibacillus paracasei subsp. tolerans]MBZ3797796.1 DUF4355 domain-containing protein [Lacticaseibacillus paracasei]QEM97561.1 DUF4355 domain-containing protein [Lacticaseibacillus paracasei]QXJ68190.1 DUF4355 domain-containing protein [Lacticaseibacillus paracasei subsp. paracasei]RNE38842.1 hypothetical protein FAM7821_01179 [Lacticaseibacillus paracasei]
MIPKILMPMNLQFFAEDNPQGDPKDPVDPPKPKDGDPVDPPEGKKQGEPADPDPDGKHVYNDEEVNEIVKKRLARAEREKQAAVDEAAKLAKMNADQKKDYELEKAQKERDELKSQLATYEMGKQARSMFEEAKLTVTEDDLQHVVTPEAESTEANVKWLIAHDQAVAEGVRQELLKGSTPKTHGSKVETPGAAFAKQRNQQSQVVNDPWKQK